MLVQRKFPQIELIVKLKNFSLRYHLHCFLVKIIRVPIRIRTDFYDSIITNLRQIRNV